MRKFAIGAFSFSAAVIVSQYLLYGKASVICAAVLFVLLFAGFIFKGERRTKWMLIAFGLCAGIVWSMVYTQMIVVPAEKLCGDEGTYRAVVTDFPKRSGSGEKVEMKLSRDGFPDVKTVAYSYDGAFSDFEPGDGIELTARLSTASEIRGEETDYYTSSGVFLIAKSVSEVKITEHPGMTLRFFHRYAAKAISDTVSKIYPEKTGGFMLALLTGNKTELNEDTETVTAMKRSGVYHVVAVSGMHVSILTSFLFMLLGKRKRAMLAAVPVLVLFMGISGFTPSVTRAVIMQLFVLTATLINRENDSVTSLSAALILLLIINPYAAKNVGLQLSFASTLGIIIFTPKIYGFFTEKFGKLQKSGKPGAFLFSTVFGGFSTSLGAVIFTMPISAAYFGYVSVIAPFTNLLVLWAIAPCFCIGAVSVILGLVWTSAGSIAAVPASVFVRYIMWVVKAVSGFYPASLYLSNTALAVWFACAYLTLIVMFIAKVKARRYLVPVCSFTIALCAILVGGIFVHRDSGEGFNMTVLDVGQGQCIVVTDSEFTAVIDCGSSGGENAAEAAMKYLSSIGRDRIDALILTHYHYDHAGYVPELISSIDADVLIAPPFSDELETENEIITLAESRGMDIMYVSEDYTVTMEDTELTLYAPMGEGGENEHGICVLVSSDGTEALITGDVEAVFERQLLRTKNIPDIECLVVGHHGSKSSTCEELLNATKPEIAVISVGYNTYGHPSDEVLERLNGFGAQVYRTDENGNITISSRDME